MKVYAGTFFPVQRIPLPLACCGRPVLPPNINCPSEKETSYKLLLHQLLDSLCSFSCHETIFLSWCWENTHLEETCLCPFGGAGWEFKPNPIHLIAPATAVSEWRIPLCLQPDRGQSSRDVLLVGEERNTAAHDILLLVEWLVWHCVVIRLDGAAFYKTQLFSNGSSPRTLPILSFWAWTWSQPDARQIFLP